MFPIFVKKIPFYYNLNKKNKVSNYENQICFYVNKNSNELLKKIKKKMSNNKDEGINYLKFQLFKSISILILINLKNKINDDIDEELKEDNLKKTIGKYIKKFYEYDMNSLIKFMRDNIMLIPSLNLIKKKLKMIFRIQNINDLIIENLQEETIDHLYSNKLETPIRSINNFDTFKNEIIPLNEISTNFKINNVSDNSFCRNEQNILSNIKNNIFKDNIKNYTLKTEKLKDNKNDCFVESNFIHLNPKDNDKNINNNINNKQNVITENKTIIDNNINQKENFINELNITTNNLKKKKNVKKTVNNIFNVLFNDNNNSDIFNPIKNNIKVNENSLNNSEKNYSTNIESEQKINKDEINSIELDSNIINKKDISNSNNFLKKKTNSKKKEVHHKYFKSKFKKKNKNINKDKNDSILDFIARETEKLLKEKKKLDEKKEDSKLKDENNINNNKNNESFIKPQNDSFQYSGSKTVNEVYKKPSIQNGYFIKQKEEQMNESYEKDKQKIMNIIKNELKKKEKINNNTCQKKNIKKLDISLITEDDTSEYY